MNRRFALIWLLLVTVLVTACSPREVREAVVTARQARAEIVSAYAEPALRPRLTALLQQEVAAKGNQDKAALEAILDPQADAAWLERQRAAGPAPTDIAITRLWTNGGRVTAAVIETYAGQAPHQFYTTRTFRRAAPGEWVLTSPLPADWGRPRMLAADGVQVVYREFDDPYVRAALPRLTAALPQIAADFGAPVMGTQMLQINVSPLASTAPVTSTPVTAMLSTTAPVTSTTAAGEGLAIAVPSPLAPGFSLALAQSPEEFLLGSMVDELGHAMLNQAYGEKATDAARLALAHTAVQWEVEQATQRDFTAGYAAQARGTPTPLRHLLDPTKGDATGNHPAERNLFLRFAVAQHGRSIIAPFLRAVFSANSADELVRSTFNQPLDQVEAGWQAWLAQRQ